MINRRDLAFGALGSAFGFLIMLGLVAIFAFFFAESCTGFPAYMERTSITNDNLDRDPYKQLEKMKEYFGDRWRGGVFDEDKDILGFCYLSDPKFNLF